MNIRDSVDSRTSDALRPGAGNKPSYGIQDSTNSMIASSSVAGPHKSRDSTDKAPPAASIVRSAVDTRGRNNRVWVEAMCCLAACVASIVSGLTLGYSSATLVELDSLDHDDAQHIFANSTLGSLFGASGPIGALFGALCVGPVSELFGRQATLMIGGVPSFIGWLFLSYAHFFETNRNGFLAFLYLGRLLTGFSTGWSMFSVSVYVAETASAKRKGLFGNCNQLFITIGVFAAYGLGALKFEYYYIALISAGVIAVFEILMLSCTYETPRWLYSKGRDLEGNKVLNILRGPNANTFKEIADIKKIIRRKYSLGEQLLAFRERATYHPFIIVMMLMFFQQFGGINAAIFYTGTIFTQAGLNKSLVNILSTVAVGVVQIIGTSISVILIDSVGRRILLSISTVGMALSTAMLGVHFYIEQDYCGGCLGDVSHCINDSRHYEFPCDQSNFGYFAVVSVIIFIAAFAIGWGPIPWTSMSELLPLRVRALGGSTATLFNWLCASIVTLAFHDYQAAITPKIAWWSFSLVLVVALVFVVLFLPEAKGHTLEEIQENFEQGHILAISCDRCRSCVRKKEEYSIID